jgi:hypothetical protein
MTEVQHSSNRLAHRVDAAQTPAIPSVVDRSADDERTYTHLLAILSVSSGMVGVCLTAIGLIGIVKKLNNVEMLVDDLLAVGSLCFMIAAVLSFLGMRTRLVKTWAGFTRALDLLFCLGLVIVVVATLLLTWMVV